MKEMDDAAADRYSTAAAHPSQSSSSFSMQANSNSAAISPPQSDLPERNPARIISNRRVGDHDGSNNSSYSKFDQRLGAGAETFDHSYAGSNNTGPFNGNAAAMVMQEMSKLKSLKRLSIGSQGSLLDPDLPFGFDWNANGEQQPASSPNSPRQSNENETWNSLTGPAFSDLSLSEGQASELLWVPASVHPELAPNEWRSYVESRVLEIKANQRSNSGSSGNNGHSSGNSSTSSGSLSPSNSVGSSGRMERRQSREIADGAQFADGSNVLAARRRSAGSDKAKRRQSILELSKQFQNLDTMSAHINSQFESPQTVRKDKPLPPLSIDTSGSTLNQSEPISPIVPSPGASLKRSSALSRRRARPELPRIRAMAEDKQSSPVPSSGSPISAVTPSQNAAEPSTTLARAATAISPHPRASAPLDELKRSVSVGVTTQAARSHPASAAAPAPEASKLLSTGARNRTRQTPFNEQQQQSQQQQQQQQSQQQSPQLQPQIQPQIQPRTPVQQQGSWHEQSKPTVEKENATPRPRPALGLRIDVGLAQQHRLEQEVQSATTAPTQQASTAVREPRSATEEKSIWRWLQKDKEKPNPEDTEKPEKPDHVEGALSPTAKAFNSLFKKKKEKPAKEITKIGPISAPSPASGSDFEAAAATAAASTSGLTNAPSSGSSSASASASTTPGGSPVLGAPLGSGNKRTASSSGFNVSSNDSASSTGHKSFSRLADKVSNRLKDQGTKNNKPSKKDGGKPHTNGSSSPAGAGSPNPAGNRSPNPDASGANATASGGDGMQLPYQIPSHHQISDKSYTMMYHRFPLHIERAIYRLSHMKLSNPHRPLREQVLLSNFMYAYLNLINQGYQQEMIAKTSSSDSSQESSSSSNVQSPSSSKQGSPQSSNSDGGEYIYGDYGAVYDYEDEDADTSGSGSDNDEYNENSVASGNQDMYYRPQAARAQP